MQGARVRRGYGIVPIVTVQFQPGMVEVVRVVVVMVVVVPKVACWALGVRCWGGGGRRWGSGDRRWRDRVGVGCVGVQVSGCVLCVGRWRRGRGIVAGDGGGLLGRARMGVGRMLDRGDGVGRAPTVMEGRLEKVATSLGALLVRGSTHMLKIMDCTLKKIHDTVPQKH